MTEIERMAERGELDMPWCPLNGALDRVPEKHRELLKAHLANGPYAASTESSAASSDTEAEQSESSVESIDETPSTGAEDSLRQQIENLKATISQNQITNL